MTTDFVVIRALEATRNLGEESASWDDILYTAREVVGADSASLIMFDSAGRLLNLTKIGFASGGAQEYAEYFYALDMIEKDSAGVPAGVWLDTSQMYSHGALSRSEFFVDYLKRYGMDQVLDYIVAATPTLHAAIRLPTQFCR